MKPSTIIKEEHTSSDESQIKQSLEKRRHRASVACTTCRDRRIRVGPRGLRCAPLTDSWTVCSTLWEKNMYPMRARKHALRY